MKIYTVTVFLFIVICSPLQAQLVQHTYQDMVSSTVTFAEKIPVIMDLRGALRIADLLSDTSLAAVDPRNVNKPDTVYYAWTNLQITNSSSRFRQEYLTCLLGFDSVWSYTIYNQEVVEQQLTGKGISVWHKTPAHIKNIIPLSLAPGETQNIWLRFRIDKPSMHQFLHRAFLLQPAEQINRFVVSSYSWQFFYLGFMVLFCLVSLYMYRLFLDYVLLYFSGLLLSFGAYFFIISGVSSLVFHDFIGHRPYMFTKVAISGIVFCYSFFLIDYLDLRVRYGVYVRIAIWSIVAMEAFSHLSPLFISYSMSAQFSNVLLLTWIFAAFFPICLTAWRGEAKGKVLLTTTTILFVTSALYLVQLSIRYSYQEASFNIFQIGTMFFAAILFYDLFFRIDTIRREKDRFQELDKLKSQVFANISHEFRTPLTLILGPLQHLGSKFTEAEDRKLLEMMQHHAGRLLELINQILDLSKLEAGKVDLKPQVVDFPALLKGMVMSFESLAVQREVRLHFASEVDELALWVDPQKIEHIFNNLLSNAFKYTKAGEEVSVLLTLKEEWAQVQVKDTGRGIAADRLPYVFNRFFQADDPQPEGVSGTGIGLTLVRELVRLHEGRISVQSTEAKGTSFRLKFPLQPSYAGSEGAIRASAALPYSEQATSTLRVSGNTFDQKALRSPQGDNAMPLVLVIEDQEDVRFYIQQNLCSYYRLLTARDGVEGVTKALEYQPDLIISDVMMPARNGYEVCRILKQDQRTSHIPFILLTAKAGREEKLQGLEEGADDYLLKPFDPEELRLRVRNLITSRQQLRQKLTESAQQAVIDPQLHATDRAFLERVYVVLDAHLGDEQFSVDTLATEVGMSRRQLNRKLKALMDVSANPFIRNYRLHKALVLLQKGEHNVSEVALATGFSSTAYFVRCFREKFGQTPGSIQ